MGLESRHAQVRSMAPGTGAVSNADFHTPWPKVTHLRRSLACAVTGQATSDAELLTLLRNAQRAADAELPSTGIDLALESVLSAAFIATPSYGTRACSLVRVGRQEVRFVEESFNAAGRMAVESQAFTLSR